jgi:hypothetical protein
MLQASVLTLAIMRKTNYTFQTEGLDSELYLELNFVKIICCFFMMVFKSP